jgi:hypothetical protein
VNLIGLYAQTTYKWEKMTEISFLRKWSRDCYIDWDKNAGELGGVGPTQPQPKTATVEPSAALNNKQKPQIRSGNLPELLKDKCI